MTDIRLSLLLTSVLGLLLNNPCSPARADQQPSAEIMTNASSGVVQVIARNCTAQNRTGSGFLWDKTTQLVTALHVISGCHNLFAYFTGFGEVPAMLRHTLLSADLAMLEVSAPASAHPLSLSSNTPQVNDTLEVIGYYFGVATLDSRPLHVTLGSSVLSDMVTDSVRNLLQSAGSPSLTTRILRLDGNMLPGLSGAPLIDAGGGVVGVGSGGLENGTVGVSWAIQAHYLTDLKNAALVAALPTPAQGPLFSAPAEGAGGSQVRCGDLVFAYVMTRTLRELLATADDIPGLIQLAATSGMPNDQLQAIRFDVYAEQNSGGSVALPRAAHLIQRGNQCVATITDGLEVSVVASKISNQMEVQQQSVAFESAFDTHGLVWGPDPSFTYGMPMMRPDGLVVRRKNFIGFAPPDIGRPVADAFETLMTRGTTFVGVRVVNTKYDPPLFQQCRLQSTKTGCAAVNAFFNSWVATALAVQMSTFPPS